MTKDEIVMKILWTILTIPFNEEFFNLKTTMED